MYKKKYLLADYPLHFIKSVMSVMSSQQVMEDDSYIIPPNSF